MLSSVAVVRRCVRCSSLILHATFSRSASGPGALRMNGCESSFEALGRCVKSITSMSARKELKSRLNCVEFGKVGGGEVGILSAARSECMLACGGSPMASSYAVIPSDQIYPHRQRTQTLSVSARDSTSIRAVKRPHVTQPIMSGTYISSLVVIFIHEYLRSHPMRLID